MAEKLTNGTFENWSSATDLDSWTEALVGSTTINRESTAANVYAGTYSCRWDVDNSHSHSSISQSFTLTAGEPYLLSFRHKFSSAVTNTLAFWISNVGWDYGLEKVGTWTQINAYNYWQVTAATTWTYVTIPFTAHASYTDYEITVAPWPYGTGTYTVYLDNLSINDDLIDHESDGVTVADVGGSGRQSVYDSVSIKDDFKYYLASSEGKIFTYSGDYLSDDGSVILSRWRSKTLDFADQIPECADGFKELTGVKLIYKDLTTATPVTIYVSTDGGTTWEHETKTLGTGSGQVLSANYHFIKTGEYFVLAIEHASTDKEFMWLQMEAKVVPLGAYFEI